VPCTGKVFLEKHGLANDNRYRRTTRPPSADFAAEVDYRATGGGARNAAVNPLGIGEHFRCMKSASMGAKGALLSAAQFVFQRRPDSLALRSPTN
jgi:hypothetical protein